MIPVSVTMQAFGPYKEKKFIDFNSLNRNGLFLITGNIGSGKTTILDAISMALYCRSTGGLRSFRELRNASCDDNLDTVVEFVFLLNQKMYMFQRTLFLHAVKGKSTKEIRDSHSCFEKRNEGWSLIASGSESKVRNVAENIIGLSCDQFSKVMVLPQGEFKNLLLASSVEKAKIFASLFKTDKYQHLTNEFLNMSQNLKVQLDQILILKDNLLKSHSIASDEQLKHEITNTNILLLDKKQKQSELIENINDLRKIIETQKTYEILKEDMKQKYKRKSDFYDQLTESKNTFGKIKLYEKKLTDLKNNMKIYLEQASILKEKLKNAQIYYDLNQKKENCQTRLSEISKELDEISKKLNSFETLLNQSKLQYENLRKIADKFPQTFVIFQELQQNNQQFVKLEKLKNDLNNVERSFNQINDDYNKQCFKIEVLLEKKKVIENNLFSQECIKLAQKLKPNEPCPVCGSLLHPCVAISDFEDKKMLTQDLENINILVTQEEQSLKVLLQNLDSQKINFISVKKNYLDQKHICKQLGCTQVENFNKLQEVSLELEAQKHANCDLQELEKLFEKYNDEFSKTQKVFDDYIEKQQNVKKNLDVILGQQKILLSQNDCLDLNSINDSITKNASRINKCECSQKDLVQKIQNAKINFEIAFSKFSDAQTLYIESEEKLKAFSEKINFNGEHLLTDNESKLEELIKQNDELFESIAQLNQTHLLLTKTDKQILKLNDEYDTLNLKYSKVEKLAQFLSGSNPRKVPIKIFVLGVMLDEVLCRANVYFAQFSNNRYSLSRSADSKSRGYSGLDIDVFDAYYGTVRSVKTLSGGELFLASISLAFGLSDAIQCCSGGIRLETIFIDEGFGSLDLQTLDTAISAFSKVIKNGRIIGIVSHVEELKNKIEAKVQID